MTDSPWRKSKPVKQAKQQSRHPAPANISDDELLDIAVELLRVRQISLMRHADLAATLTDIPPHARLNMARSLSDAATRKEYSLTLKFKNLLGFDDEKYQALLLGAEYELAQREQK